MESFSIADFQRYLQEVKLKHFHPLAVYDSAARAMNICEEAGELAREERLVRDGNQLNEERAKDAVGDIFIALTGYCITHNFNFEEVIKETWQSLKKRWESGQLVGVPPSRQQGEAR